MISKYQMTEQEERKLFGTKLKKEIESLEGWFHSKAIKVLLELEKQNF